MMILDIIMLYSSFGEQLHELADRFAAPPKLMLLYGAAHHLPKRRKA